jgi:uncharacterized membrane protein (DUF4010 family)
MPDSHVSVFLNGQTETAFQLLVALLLGALIGLQRGWVTRQQPAGERVAGIRTHTLTGLFGGIAALLAAKLTVWLMPVMLLVIAAVAISGYRVQTSQTRNYSITGVIGLLLTFCFGAMATSGEAVLAAMAAVVTTIILDKKVEIHTALQKLQENELDAALKLLLISVVMLPLLPRHGIGPGGLLNLYEIWWMVVLIASISFIGYFSVRIAGPRKGLLFTSLFAGLSSSTALTLHFSRLARNSPASIPLLAAGIMIACGTMFPRILLYCLLVNPALTDILLVPILVMTLMLYIPALVISLRHQKTDAPQPDAAQPDAAQPDAAQPNAAQPDLARNPLELQSALILGGLLVVIVLLSQWLSQTLGDTGIYLLAAISGISDVDAISLSLSRLSLADSLTVEVAATGILIAVTVNNIFKTLLTLMIGKPALAVRVALPMLLSVTTGFLLLWWLAG